MIRKKTLPITIFFYSLMFFSSVQAKLEFDFDLDKTELQNKLKQAQIKNNKQLQNNVPVINNTKSTISDSIISSIPELPEPPQPIAPAIAEPKKHTLDAGPIEIVQESLPIVKEETIVEEVAESIADQDSLPKNLPQPEQPIRKQKIKKSKKTKDPLIAFSFNNEKLTTIINKIAAKKGLNVVLPQGADAIKTTITFEQKNKIPLSLAEKFMYQFLDLAGYMMHPNNGFFAIVKKTDNTVNRTPLHLYINVPPNNLPQSDEVIRAIYFLANFKVPETTQGNEPLNLILKDMLGTKKGYLFDPVSNAVILNGSANKIASVMTIILELDNSGSPETVEVFPLFNATASTVAKLLNDQIISTIKDKKPGMRGPVKGGTGLYFAPNTRIVPDPRTNSLIIIGTESAVNRIKDFVRDYMDQPADSGRSILHIYDLQYLNSREFAQVLKNILRKDSSGQSEKEGGEGPQRFFEDVIVVPEEEQIVESQTVGGATTQSKGKVTVGGNRLIIAAKTSDWVQIKSLIEQLDKPQLQVIIEVMILDLTMSSNKLLQAQTRNPRILDLHENIEFQTAHMRQQLLNEENTSLAADLLRLISVSPNPAESMAVPETSGNGGLGSMIISLNDSCKDGIWSVLKILDQWAETKIISHPFLVTKNNVKAREAAVDIRRGRGAEDTTGSVTTIKEQDYKATLAIEVTPRISSLDRLNLQLTIDVENFLSSATSTTAFNKAVRSIETNANLSSGQILVLGGLTRTEEGESETKWPILGDLPIVGALFRGTSKSNIKSNLVIFVHPTIVDPKLRAGQNIYTNDKIETEYDRFAEGNLFGNSKDPVTRFFFRSSGQTNEEGLTTYLERAYYNKQPDDYSHYQVNDDLTYLKPSEAAKIKELITNEDNPLQSTNRASRGR